MPNGEFVFGAEHECQMSLGKGVTIERDHVLKKLIRTQGSLAPSLRSDAGFFNGYGRAYIDCGHLELATAECDCPYLLAVIIEQQQQLAAMAAAQLTETGCPVQLANNNHSELLHESSPTWGTHENYLVGTHPKKFTDAILPFLITRFYGGSGGVEYPTGNFLAGVRPKFMRHATGGGTTEERAIHSTAREEHHMGSQPNRFRYHLILGDGHRSHFNVALQFGATALAAKAVICDRPMLAALDRRKCGNWVSTLQGFNVLTSSDAPPRINPHVLEIQQLYLDGARRYAERLDQPPAWISRLLADWQATLDAARRHDLEWLSARLDAFAKYQLFTSILHEAACGWRQLARRKNLFYELALVDHSYHAFTDPQSVFLRLEQAGLIRHAVGEAIRPGGEPEPHVPPTATRAAARARFIRERSGDDRFHMTWSFVVDRSANRRATLYDPFATAYSSWASGDEEVSILEHILLRQRSTDPAAILQQLYEHGDYEQCSAVADQLNFHPRFRRSCLRFKAWAQSRRGFLDGPQYLDRLYDGQDMTLTAVVDYGTVYRFRGLSIADEIELWLARGREILDGFANADAEPPEAGLFREYLAAWLLQQGQVDESVRVLREALQPERLSGTATRIQGRMWCLLAECQRRLGQHMRAGRSFAKGTRELRDYPGALADFALTGRAKLSRQPAHALRLLNQAKHSQESFGNRVGLTRSLLIEARLRNQPAEALRQQVQQFRESRPALRACPTVTQILDHWDDWVGGEASEGFWQL